MSDIWTCELYSFKAPKTLSVWDEWIEAQLITTDEYQSYHNYLMSKKRDISRVYRLFT